MAACTMFFHEYLSLKCAVDLKQNRVSIDNLHGKVEIFLPLQQLDFSNTPNLVSAIRAFFPRCIGVLCAGKHYSEFAEPCDGFSF